MELIQAVVEAFKAVVWPVTIIYLIHLFKTPLAELLRSLREGKLKYKDIEIILNRDLAAARQSLEDVRSQGQQVLNDTSKVDHELIQIAKISPRAAILEAWSQLERIGSISVQKYLDDPPRHLKSPVSFGEALRSQDLISSEIMSAIMKLRDIRNRTAHAAEYQPTVSEAEEYVLLTQAVASDLERIKTN